MIEQGFYSRVGWAGNEVAPAQLELPGAVATTCVGGSDVAKCTQPARMSERRS